MKSFILLFTCILLTAGCSKNVLSAKEKEAAYLDYIQANQLERIDRARSFRFHGWSALTSRYLILSSSPRKNYLIELVRPCHDLTFTHQLIVKQSSSSTLQTKFDSVVTTEQPEIECRIKFIHPISKEQAKEIKQIGEEEHSEQVTAKDSQ